MLLTIIIALALAYLVYRAYQYKNGIKWVYVALTIAVAFLVVPLVSEQISKVFDTVSDGVGMTNDQPDSLD